MEIVKNLEYWRQNAEEDYLTTPISVLAYITKLENAIEDGLYTRNQMHNAIDLAKNTLVYTTDEIIDISGQ